MWTDQAASPEERSHRSEQFQCCYRVLGPGFVICPGAPLHHRGLRAAQNHWPIAFALEGSPLDRRVTLNCGSKLIQTTEESAILEFFAVAHIGDFFRLYL